MATVGPQTVNKGRVKLARSSWRCENEKVTINNRIKEDEITQELLERWECLQWWEIRQELTSACSTPPEHLPVSHLTPCILSRALAPPCIQKSDHKNALPHLSLSRFLGHRTPLFLFNVWNGETNYWAVETREKVGWTDLWERLNLPIL